METYPQLKTGVVFIAVLTALLCQNAFGQEAQGKDAQNRTKGLPPRATPADYQAHAQVGSITIGAEFAGHSVPDPQSALSTEDYVVVEVGLFGQPGSKLQLSYEDFSLRINGKKTPLPSQPYALVFKSLKDPTWEPPANAEHKSKGGVTTGGQGQADSGPPPVVHVPIEVERAMELRVQKASLPEGERVLPEAGLIFFEHRGKTNSIELIYSGPAGKMVLPLQP